MKSLNKRQLLLLHAALLEASGGASGVRDDSLLESALGYTVSDLCGAGAIPDGS
jgi:prophage maintenance system killer protein